MKKAFWCALVFLMLVVLGACYPRSQCVQFDLGQAFIAENFAAADGLASNATARIDPDGRILVLSFVNRERPDAPPRFGRLVAAQFSSRLTQLGHALFEANLPWRIGTATGTFAPTPEQARLLQSDFDAWAVLIGTYTVDMETVFVSARIIRLSDGVVVGAHEYSLPRKGVVVRLLDDPERYDRILEAHMRTRRAETPDVIITPPTRLRERDVPPDQGGVSRIFPPERLNE
ncbi:MAG: FlgO family outer membrane protein [Thermodesulfobacteriota bacterium]|nr:FlgO family outer membrane protein [Thermodesulfobacteriota bacterium]